ncbi:uncharacterized protein IL334_007039 [Kwoniella shivajii]|uniref:Uncharacterized protein n=1 Tax=Kwoniella shivajii TaxID=564305 RepID=A0ABZ1D7K5_9TREE|nr:hypothetical protein IL334_007039 [Kwoniella shivajii]
MTFLLTHSTSLSLTSISKPLPSQITLNSIPLPSRFPASSNSKPETSISPSGYIYLYSHSSHVIWEYDSKGRRISELSFPNEKVNKSLAIGQVNGKENVLVYLGKEELRLMEKEDGKWNCINTLQTPRGRLTALTCSATSTLVAAGSDKGELVVYDQVKGVRRVIPLGDRSDGPISPLLTFAPSLPSTLLLPTSSALLRLTIPSPFDDNAKAIDIKELPVKGTVIDITFSPIVESSDGSKKGGLCAILKKGGEVALVGIESESTPKTISFEEELVGLIFLDGANLAGRTKSGSLMVKDLRALNKPSTPISCPEPITSIRLLPSASRAPRPSFAPSTSSSRRTPLGERNTGNLPTLPPVPVLKHDFKGKQPIRTDIGDVRTESQKTQAGFSEEKTRTRIVSTPMSNLVNQPERIKSRQSTGRSTSGPIGPSSYRPPAEVRIPERITSSIIEEVEEGSSSSGLHRTEAHQTEPICNQEAQSGGGENNEPSIHLDWALQPPAMRSAQGNRKEVTASEKMEEMRREIGNLQLDMLRMGRDLKNDIRKAVQPLLAELKSNQEVIAKQKREIERLRRGY